MNKNENKNIFKNMLKNVEVFIWKNKKCFKKIIFLTNESKWTMDKWENR